MKVVIRTVTNPIEGKEINIGKISAFIDLIKKYDEWLILRIFNHKLEAIVFDGYIAHKKWNTKQQCMEIADKQRAINNLEKTKDTLHKKLNGMTNRYFKLKKRISDGEWRDNGYVYSIKKEKIKKRIKNLPDGE